MRRAGFDFLHHPNRLFSLLASSPCRKGGVLGKSPCRGIFFDNSLPGDFFDPPRRSGSFSTHPVGRGFFRPTPSVGDFFRPTPSVGDFFDPPRPSLAREGSTPLPKPLAPQGRGDVTALLGAQNRAELSKVSASEAFALKGWRLAYATKLRFLYAIELRLFYA